MMEPTFNPSLLRLLQIVSPSLPVGGYSYSQGLEWAVNAGWVADARSFDTWLDEQLHGVIAYQDLPLLLRMYRAIDSENTELISFWDSMSLAMRETNELRLEEQQRGQALIGLLDKLEIPPPVPIESQLCAFALFCVAEGISLNDSMAGYAYNWLDGQVTAAIKLVPLGQSEGQAMLYRQSASIPDILRQAVSVEDEDVGYTSPALSMASCLHETQYTRLFRS